MSLPIQCDGQFLPFNYNYLFDEKEKESDLSRNEITFRIKEIIDEDSVKMWLKEFEELNAVTWRILRTFPNSGKVNVYKVCLRCQHFTDRRVQMIRSTKNTNCPAEMVITVKRIVKKSKSKYVQNVDYPTIIIMKHQHNHSLNSPVICKYRDMSDETKNKLLSLFRNGHSPSSAWHIHNNNLMLEYGDDYSKVASDGRFLPSVSKVYKMFTKFANEYRTRDVENSFDNNDEIIFIENSSEFENNDEEIILIENFSENTAVQEEKLSVEEHKQFNHIFDRIKIGLVNNPESFVPAVRKMLENSNLYSTDAGLISSLYTFGTHIVPQFRNISSNIVKMGGASVSRKRKLTEVQDKKNETIMEHNYCTNFALVTAQK